MSLFDSERNAIFEFSIAESKNRAKAQLSGELVREPEATRETVFGEEAAPEPDEAVVAPQPTDAPEAPRWHDHMIVAFNGATSTRPLPMKLIDLIEMPAQNVPKTDALAFIPSSFSGPKARRKEAQEEHGQRVALLVDYDGGADDIRIIEDALDAFTDGSPWAAYTTCSATPENPRMRIIVPLDQPVSFEVWRAGQDVLCAHLAAAGVPVDDCANRASQLSFAPNKTPDKFFKRSARNLDAEAISLNSPEFEPRITEARERLAAAKVKERPAGPAKVADTDSVYGLKALEAECAKIRDTMPCVNGSPGQNDALNKASFVIGQLVGGGELTWGTAIEAVVDAGLDMLSDPTKGEWDLDEIVALVNRAMSDGVKKPRCAPEREDVAAVFKGVHLPIDEPAFSIVDFLSYMLTTQYIFIPTGEMWPATRVNARVPPVDLGDGKTVRATSWLDENRAVEQMVWLPGGEKIIADKLISGGGWIERPGCNVFNLYRPPLELKGDAKLAGPFLDHVLKLYPDESDHILKYLAHRVQRPGEKINHALVLGGAQGIGKDTILEPVKVAVGPWNFNEVSPQNMLGRFNGFGQSVILRVSEARDLGDLDRFKFYDHMKTYTAAPPDVLRIDQKYQPEHSAFNVCGVIITTNYKTGGIFLPADDRRHFVAWSDLTKQNFEDGYFDRLYQWLLDGGTGHVAACLRGLDLSGFNAKAAPPKTDAFWTIVSANTQPEDSELADALDKMGRLPAVTIAQVLEAVALGSPLSEYLRERKNNKRIQYRFEQCGYVPVRNEAAKDGHFVVEGKRCVIYGLIALSIRDRIAAARRVAAW